MKKSILNLGSPISRKSQQLIFGGNDQSCTYYSCPTGYSCYHNGTGTFCSDLEEKDHGLTAIKLPPPPISIGGGDDGNTGGD